MYCKHCGAEINDSDRFCTHCGAAVEEGSTFSSTGGNGFTSCMSSDLRNASSTKSDNISPCSRLIAGLLCWFLGIFGAHRFYTKKTTSAIFMLLFFWTILPGFIVTIIDFIMILCGTYKDGDGKEVKAL